MRKHRQSSFAAVLVALGAMGCAPAPQTGSGSVAMSQNWRADFPTFEKHTVDAEFRGGYQGIAADVDGDGLEDIVAVSTGPLFRWYRNPTWQAYDIQTGTERLINTAPYDIDGDGDLDFALASSFNLNDSENGGMVGWAENPGDPTTTTTWRLHPIDQVPTSHRLRWADLNGDGMKELINLPIVGIGATGPTYEGASEMQAYPIPRDPRGEWSSLTLDRNRLEVAHGLEVVDWNGDRADDLLTASNAGVFVYQAAADGRPTGVLQLTQGAEGPRPERGSSEVGVGEMGAGNRFVATMDPWHGDQVVIYTPPQGDGPWLRNVIDTGVDGGHGLVTADLNNDGYDEVIAGGRSGDRLLNIYRYMEPTGEWVKIPLDVGGVAVSGLDTADLNGDGAVDIIAVGSSTGNVVWFENRGW